MRDDAEGISSISWTVYGKIATITKTNGLVITYVYDASGNRVSKHLGTTAKTTVYVRDASGNVMGVYEKTGSAALELSETHLYGSSRLGIAGKLTVAPQSTALAGGYGTGMLRTFTRGEKFFELSHHLGNVLATVSDKKIQNGSGTLVSGYTADVVSASDYYPFGMQMPGRVLETAKYRYGFNGKENDNEVKGEGNQQDYGMRIYDTRLGRFLSVDPLTVGYPMLTPYQFASNKPVSGVDLDGNEFRLSIFDPNITENFLNSLNDGDIYGARKIILSAMNTKIPEEVNENIIRAYQWNGDNLKNTNRLMGGEYQAKLVYDNTVEGLVIDMNMGAGHPTNAKADTDFTFIWMETKIFAKSNDKIYPDVNYPVDIRTINSPLYKDFYKDYDFVGEYRAGGTAIATGTNAEGEIWGNLKGYGYVKYNTRFFGFSSSISALQGEWGLVKGKFTGHGGSFNQNTLEGWGTQSGGSLGMFSGGYWQGYQSEADARNLRNPTFIGHFISINTTLNISNPFKKGKSGNAIGAQVGFTYSVLEKYKKSK